MVPLLSIQVAPLVCTPLPQETEHSPHVENLKRERKGLRKGEGSIPPSSAYLSIAILPINSSNRTMMRGDLREGRDRDREGEGKGTVPLSQLHLHIEHVSFLLLHHTNENTEERREWIE